MGVVDDKLALFDQIVALRRAESQAPDVREIPLVRSQLEHRLGPSANLMMAGRILGLSQTTIDRWARRGDLPVVVTESGRREVPITTLVELRERVEAERDAGRSHVMEPIVREWRDAAANMTVEHDLPPDADIHARSAARSLAYHRAVARKLTRRIVDTARRRLREWEDAGSIDAGYARAWSDLLEQPLTEIEARLSSDDERMADLRQSSPFAGALSEPERRRILDEVR